MRVLVANIPLPNNRFLADLNEALSRATSLVHSHEHFWAMSGDYDIVHLHFPEYLTPEIQKAYVEGMPDDLIEQLKQRLQFWSGRASIVITRHVLLPHAARDDPRWETLYELVYRYADGVAHFAQASIEEFRNRYAQTEFLRGAPIHSVIPHHNYCALPNSVSRKEARRKLGLPDDSQIMLVFGAIRNDRERQLVLDTFHEMNVPRKLLLVSRWREKLPRVAWIRLKYWLRDLNRLYYRIHPRYRFNYSFVPEEDTQHYLNAADVLFIPRFHVLNSGNVTLGMTFGRVVVGPDSWDVGELLREMENPVFDPENPGSAPIAMEEAFQLARDNSIPSQNRERALSEWSTDRCATSYYNLYEQAIERLASHS